MVDIRKRLGKNLRKIITQRKSNLERFAYEAHISRAYVYDIANGKANVSITMLQRIAKVLKIKPQDLIS